MHLNKLFLVFLFLVFISPSFGQVERPEAVIDSLYREDQIYVGFSYNLLTASPEEIVGKQFSGGLHIGVMRDFPINDRRNLAFAAGLGWSIDTYGQHLFIGEDNESGKSIFRVLDREQLDFDTNRFVTQSVDLPIQLRWRTSTLETYKFWRIYAGVRPAYVYYFRSNFEQAGNRVRQTNVPELQKFRLGASIIIGYNTFNFQFYYDLNSFFKEATLVNGQEIDLRTFQVGLMFYLL